MRRSDKISSCFHDDDIEEKCWGSSHPGVDDEFYNEDEVSLDDEIDENHGGYDGDLVIN